MTGSARFSLLILLLVGAWDSPWHQQQRPLAVNALHVLTNNYYKKQHRPSSRLYARVTPPTASAAAIASATRSTTARLPVLQRQKRSSTSPKSTVNEKAQTSKNKSFTSPLLDPWRDYDFLRTADPLDEAQLQQFFWRRPTVIAHRLADVTLTLRTARDKWDAYGNIQDAADPAAAVAAGGLKTDPTATVDRQQALVEQRAAELCSAISSLGPVAVKVGQTLSQRPDLVGRDAALALQRLQTSATPFANDLATAVMCEAWQVAQVAPGRGIDTTDSNVRPVFRSMTDQPIAAASLGQVYRAVTWDNQTVAVKVQRPDAMQALAIDLQCFRTVFGLRQSWRRIFDEPSSDELVRGSQNVGAVINRVGADVWRELNYTLEAEHATEFAQRLEPYIDFVTTTVAVPEYLHERCLVTEWIPGRHLDALTPAEGLRLTRQAVQACTATLVGTGLVHADPHAGNLMLHDDGRLVFLDFGLVSYVDEPYMEAFARGIQALLARDYPAVVDAFCDVEFVNVPIMHRHSISDAWTEDPDYGRPQLAVELAEAIENTAGGAARFGALATVLNQKISPRWLVFTPPYVLLLIRTFLTLEGIAAQVDPDFNIYQMAMPWAVRRSLSPSTDVGTQVFRRAILREDGKLQWDRLMELMAPATSVKEAETPPPTTTVYSASGVTTLSSATTNVNDEEAASVDVTSQVDHKQQNQDATKQALNNAVGSLLGCTEGKVLRRTLWDLDSRDLVRRLASREGRQLLAKTVPQRGNSKKKALVVQKYPVSEKNARIRARQHKWQKRVRQLLWRSHLRRNRSVGGMVALTRLAVVWMSVAMKVTMKRCWTAWRPSRLRRSSSSRDPALRGACHENNTAQNVQR